MNNGRTITAITTPIGEGGISVIHVSGTSSIEIANKIFRGKRVKDLSQAEDGRLYYGNIMEDEVPVDEAIISVSKKDGSFTGQDLVEINCHGGILATRKALNCIKAAGAVEVGWQELAAESAPGGQNNKIDPIQREALLEIPKARTTLAVKVFLDQYKGALSAELFKCGIRSEECGMPKGEHLNSAIRNSQSALIKLLKTADFGIALSVPLKVTIAGSPNAGKSTLINAMLGRERAIVHHEPGTTRDAVTDIISVEGIPLELTDTAGIRNANDVIEDLAIEETVRRLSVTDIAVIVFDNSRPLNEDEVGVINALETLKGKSHVEIIPVVNKIDLPSALDITELQSHFSRPVCPMSALNGNGISELSSQLITRFADYVKYVPGRPIVFTERQKRLINELGLFSI
jgi:tRNA modification GTPase